MESYRDHAAGIFARAMPDSQSDNKRKLKIGYDSCWITLNMEDGILHFSWHFVWSVDKPK
jgi:hypothetical protein